MSADQQENKQSCGDNAQDYHAKVAFFMEHAAHHDRAHQSRCPSGKG